MKSYDSTLQRMRGWRRDVNNSRGFFARWKTFKTFFKVWGDYLTISHEKIANKLNNKQQKIENQATVIKLIKF